MRRRSAALGATCAPGSTTADGCTPGGDRRRRMQDRRDLRVDRVRVGARRASAAPCSPAISGATITADARVAASCARYLRIGEKRDRAGSGRLERRDARDRAPRRRRRAWRRCAAASSAREIGTGRAMSRDAGGGAPARRRAPPLLVGERLDHLLGDVDLLAREDDRVLQDQVELLGLGDLLDHLVRALLDARELLVAAQVEVLAELALRRAAGRATGWRGRAPCCGGRSRTS